MKGYQTERGGLIAREALGSEGQVLTLQNGMGNIEILRKVIGRDCILGGTTSLGALIVSPGIHKL